MNETETGVEDLGTCQRCEKNKATIRFTEGTMAFVHGFVENICQDCYDKMQKETPLYKEAVKERNAEVKQAIEELDWNQIEFEAEKVDGCDTGHYFPNKKELLQKLGLEK